ncbi:MAG: PD40 domain-containing protein [Acidobacteria bacterium]|nr:PD40 domain-containing protein [Acidobacteriota bacterium]
MSWGDDGLLVAHADRGIERISPDGQRKEMLIAALPGEAVTAPVMLPGGRAVMFTTLAGGLGNRTGERRVVVQRLGTSDRKVIIENGGDAVYVSTGHIVYASGGTLFAVPFDVERLETFGTSQNVVEGVRRNAVLLPVSQFAVSRNGSLFYIAGSTSGDGATDLELALVDRHGSVTRLKSPLGGYEAPRVSPDGRYLAVGSDNGQDAIVWIHDLLNSMSLRRLTLEGRNRFPVWSHDGARVVYQSDRDGDRALFWQRADGSGTVERLTPRDPKLEYIPESVSPDGRDLLAAVNDGSRTTLSLLTLGDRSIAPFGSVTSLFPTGAAFSPDGRWVAYAVKRDLKTNAAVFVQPFPADGTVYPVSSDDDGHHPMWSRDGRELFYVPGPQRLVSVRVDTTKGFAFSTPQPAAPAGIQGPVQIVRNSDPLRDGSRFAAVVYSGAASSQGIHAVLNWSRELRK